MRYPNAEWVPWVYTSSSGQPTYWKGICKPEAVVLHIMAGYATTARQWANSGYYGASWHFTVGKDGKVMQHLDTTDAGYQAGITDTAPIPTWKLWKGRGKNVNHYTLGIEHEGFPGDEMTPAQAQASKDLCLWIAQSLNIPFDKDHFPAHAEIDVVNRVNDFNYPDLRAKHYAYLFGGEGSPMTTQERTMIAIAFGDYERMKKSYFALANAGLINEAVEGRSDIIEAEQSGDQARLLNAVMVCRFRIAELAATNPNAAYDVIK